MMVCLTEPLVDNHRVYKIDIETSLSKWSVVKRFSEFIDLDKKLREEFNSQMANIIKMPKKKLFDSISIETCSERLSILSIYVSDLSQIDVIVSSQILSRFLRTDVFLESYVDLIEGDEIRELECRASKLEEKINSLYRINNKNQSEVSEIYNKFIESDISIDTLKKKMNAFISNLKRVSLNRSNIREKKAQLVSDIDNIKNNYTNIYQILFSNKDKIWRKISSIGIINDDICLLSGDLNNISRSMDLIGNRANSIEITELSNLIKNIRDKSDDLIELITQSSAGGADDALSAFS